MTAPLALVYRGPAATPMGCSEAVARLLRTSPWGFDVRYVGPGESLPLTAGVLAAAALYAQPGGGTLKRAYRSMRRHREAIRGYTASGGRYLGFCLGGYLAGATPGFALLPGDTDQYITSAGATVRSGRDTVVEVRWRKRRRCLYFQDGPLFDVRPDARDVDVVAWYPNRTVAALVAPFDGGRVAVVGPHPEATVDWYEDSGLALPGQPGPGQSPRPGLGHDLGHELIDAVMR